MSDFRPADLILYRDGDRYGVARVDLVREKHLTCFPFDPTHRRWSKINRRIARHLVIQRLSRFSRPAAIAAQIEALRHERDAKRQQANTWLETRIRELVQEAV